MKKAFTLAEVLITLGIIGVVAAMTMPTLIQKQQDVATVSRLEKAYSILSQAVISAQQEYGEIDFWTIVDNNQESTRENFARVEPYLKIVRKCDNEAGCWAKQTQSLSGEQARWSTDFGFGVDYMGFTLNDGTNVVFDFTTPSLSEIFGFPEYLDSAYIIFYVDVNGDKRPNKFGRDIFVFALGPKGLIPAGIANNSANCSPSIKSNISGYDCAYKVLQEKAIKY